MASVAIQMKRKISAMAPGAKRSAAARLSPVALPFLLAAQTSFGQSPARESAFPWPGLVIAGLGIALALVLFLWSRERGKAGEIRRTAADSSADLQAQEILVASGAERISAILQSILEAIITTDIDGRILRVNRSAEKLLGKASADLEGAMVTEMLELRSEIERDSGFDVIAALRESLVPTQFDGLFHLQTPNAEERRVELSGAPVRPKGELDGFVLALRDVTDRQLVEAELANAQKLESLGLLASGIAHEFNNLLTIALGNLSLLSTEDELADALGPPLGEVEKALLRARGLADQLLTFASGGVPRNQPTDLADLVRRSVSMVFRDDDKLFDLDLPEDLPEVDVDPDQITQVLNNLLLEARQGAEGSKVRISARQERVGGVRGTKLAPGLYLRLDIFDGGQGLSPEEQERIFEPYASQRGGTTGMGLATSQAVVKRHRGAIEVKSEAGEGTTFSLLLRAAKRAKVRRPKTAQPSRRPTSGRVLIMDDEHSILALLSAALKRLGFEAVTTTDGEAAIEAAQSARQDGSPFDVAILDLKIPGGMGGIDAAAALRDKEPELLLVASSGYSQNPALVEPRRHGFDEALVKPYRIPDLAKLFDRLLASAP